MIDKTTKLRLTFAQRWQMHERQIRDGATGAAMIVALLLIHSLLRPAPAPLSAPIVMRESQRPAILVATATPAPTMPPQPTATPIVEVRYLEAPTLPPIVEYVEVPVYVAAPAPAQEAAPVVEAPPTLEPQQAAILDRQQWALQAAERSR